jgi:hypothetical protein
MSTTIRVNVTKEILQRSSLCGKEGFVREHEMTGQERVSIERRKQTMADPASAPKDYQSGIVNNCAIALAIWDVIPFISVDFCTIDFYTPKEYLSEVGRPYATTHLCEEAQALINRFDNSTPEGRRNMEPLSFELDIPDSVVENVSIEEITRLIEKCPTVELV